MSNASQITTKQRAILLGDRLLCALTAPGFVVPELLGVEHPDRQIAAGIVISAVGLPVTLPALLIFGPPWLAYAKYFDVPRLKEQLELEEYLGQDDRL